MTNKAPSFSLYLFGTPMIIMNRLKGSDNYQSRANSVKLWFIGNGVEDHFTSQSIVFLKINALLYNIL